MRIATLSISILLVSFNYCGCLSSQIESEDAEEPQDGEGTKSEFDLNLGIKDLDMDGIADEIDHDLDGDGWGNEEENMCGTDPENVSESPNDKDSDGICDTLDPDLEGLLEEFRSIEEFDSFTDNPEWYGLNITTWQMEHGGWGKGNKEAYMNPWDGVEPPSPYTCGMPDCPDGRYLGTLDNNATTSEIRFISMLYNSSSSEENRTIFRDSANLGLDFIFNSQYSSGGWPQVFPERYGAYSNLVTFNDHAMVRTMILLWDIHEKRTPFDSGIFSGINESNLNTALNRGMDFILRSQIRVEGNLTVWCQQHDPESYAPMPGRPYELPAKSGWESAGVAALLLNWPDRTPEIENATRGAVNWFHENKIDGQVFIHKSGEIGEFADSEGAMMWYRFYNISDNQFFMSGRDSVKVYDIRNLTDEMRTSYQWAGDWGTGIVTETSKMEEWKIAPD